MTLQLKLRWVLLLGFIALVFALVFALMSALGYQFRAQVTHYAHKLYAHYKTAVHQKTQQDHYREWGEKNPKQHQLSQAYHQFLAKHLSQRLVKQGFSKKDMYMPPPHELLYNSHAAKKSACNLPLFNVPPRKQWRQLVSTLVLVNVLKDKGIIGSVHIKSGYRNPQTNHCVGGSKASKHMKNAALDFTLKSNLASEQLTTDKKLCQFWRKQGRKLRMGLGTYGKGRYHIDTQGFRTWGGDYKRGTSLCLTKN